MKTIVSLALAGLMSISALLPTLAAQEAESVSIAESSSISESMAQDESSVSSSDVYKRQVHDRHAVGDVLDHRQVMGDEEVGELAFFLESVSYTHLHGIVGQDDAYILPFLDHDSVRL